MMLHVRFNGDTKWSRENIKKERIAACDRHAPFSKGTRLLQRNGDRDRPVVVEKQRDRRIN